MSNARRVYPRSGAILLDGGKNNKFERSLIEDNESPSCLNVVFENGAAATRQGVAKLNSTAIGSYVGDGIYTRHDSGGSETMIVFAGGSAWEWSGTTFSTISSAQSVFTAGVRVAATEYENHLFIGNGGVIPYKYNGTAFTRHGVYPPVSAMAANSASTGTVLNGTYSWKVTFVNTALAESDVSPALTFSVTNKNVALSSIPVAPQSWGVSARRIYRTEVGGSTYKRVTTISDNTTTTYEDGVADASLGATAPTDNGVPPKYSVCVYHQDRLFMNDPANPNFVWYTELGEPYTVKTTSFRRAGDASGDIVRTLSRYGDSILIGCDKSLWLLYMPDTDPTNWKMLRVKSAYGSRSPFCLLDFQEKHLFPAMQNDKFVGFGAVSGAEVEPSATFLTVSTAGSDLQSDRIEPDMFEIQESFVGDISGIVFKNKAWIAVAYGSGATTNNRVYQMDFSISNLSKDQRLSWAPFTGLSPAQFTVYEGNLYFVSSTATGFVYQCEAGVYNDDGAAIDSYIWTKEYSGYAEDENNDKDFRFANILVDKAGAYYMNVTYRVDSDSGDGVTKQIDLDPGGSVWGVMTWGQDNWGGGMAQENIKLGLGTARGKRIQFKFSNQNTVNQRFKVHKMNFTYNLKGQR